MLTRQMRAAEVAAVASLQPQPGILCLSGADIVAEFAAERMRPEWSWVVEDDEGRVIGRALWWGRDGSRPLALDVLDVDAPTPEQEGIGEMLLRAGHAGLARLGHESPVAYTLRLPDEWHDRPDSNAAVAWRIAAARQGGLTLLNERLQLRWTPRRTQQPELSSLCRLTFRPGDDAEFVELFEQTAQGSLDVMTRRCLASMAAQALARQELDFYRSCPGDRSWWQVATGSDGVIVGFVIPSATPHHRNVGYLGVLPRHRGHGYVHELLEFVTRFHAASGAVQITAATDVDNIPMATAFVRAGYDVVERRLDVEPADGRPEVVLMCGVAGSGKTTYAKDLETRGHVRLSVDEEVWERFGRFGLDYDQSSYEAHSAVARGWLDERLTSLVEQGRDVVVDSSLWQRERRDEVKCLVEHAGGRWRLVYLSVSDTVLRERLAERARRVDANAAFPITDEILTRFLSSFEVPSGEGEEVVTVTGG